MICEFLIKAEEFVPTSSKTPPPRVVDWLLEIVDWVITSAAPPRNTAATPPPDEPKFLSMTMSTSVSDSLERIAPPPPKGCPPVSASPDIATTAAVDFPSSMLKIRLPSPFTTVGVGSRSDADGCKRRRQPDFQHRRWKIDRSRRRNIWTGADGRAAFRWRRRDSF